MRMVDLIYKKRDGQELTCDEIEFFVEEYTKGNIPDYQASAMMMAIYFSGMTSKETSVLTMAMANSGDTVDLSSISGIKVDKHSTGGVGDKTTLIVVPIAAACGVKIAKMSGRGLSHTGGTVDKLESISGFRTEIERDEFLHIVEETGCAVIGQSGNLCPADKKLYGLRDVTATVESVPLIASSIMSKKIAAGADRILLDVKTGSGAFMKSVEEAKSLAEEMVAIGKEVGRKTIALITDMGSPLGRNIGNALEIKEVCEVLKGNGTDDLTEISITLAANMILLGEKVETIEQAEKLARESIKSGKAFDKLKEMVKAQGGDESELDDTEKLPKSKTSHKILADKAGYVEEIDALMCGKASVILGAGRETKDSKLDLGAGIILLKKNGDEIKAGDEIAEVFAENMDKCIEAEKIIHGAYKIGDKKPEKQKSVLAICS